MAKEFLKSAPSEERLVLKLTAMYLAASLVFAAAIIAIDKLVLPLNPTRLAPVSLFILNPLLIVPFLARFLRERRGLRTA